MSLALALPDDALVVTLTDGGRALPLWHRALGWPVTGGEHIPLVAADVRKRARAAARLDGTVKLATRPIILIAEGAGCFAAAWWARLTPPHEQAGIAGALLFDPLADGDGDVRAAYESPAAPLPFPALLLGPDTDDRDRALARLAQEWGGRVAALPRPPARPVARSPWRQAGQMIGRYTAHIVKRDIRLAHHRAR